VRVAHAVFGMLVAVGWLVAPIAAASADDPVTGATDGLSAAISGAPLAPLSGGADPAGPGGRTDAARAAPAEDETSTGDLALPLVAAVAAGTLAAYSFLRRKRRAHTRTTPGGAPPRTADGSSTPSATDPPDPGPGRGREAGAPEAPDTPDGVGGPRPGA
jgi:hypothetical protein